MTEEIGEKTVLRKLLEVTHPLQEEGQVAVFDEARSELVMLNAVGGAVWEFLDGKVTLGEIASELSSNIQQAPSREEVLSLVVEFTKKLLERGAVAVVEPS